MSAVIGRSLELYYIDGRPDGMVTAELFNWTGHVLMTPRTQIPAALSRQEARSTGVYILLGEKDGEPYAYIGQAEDISARIPSHIAARDWWTSAVLVTTAGNKLNKAHVGFLEARLIATARKIGRVPLDNGTNPPLPSLSEADIAKMESFLENLLIVLPAVRVDMFIERSRPAGSAIAALVISPITNLLTSAAPVEARFSLGSRRHGLHATAVLRGGEFIVEAGSGARSAWEGKAGQTTSYGPLHTELIRSGVLVPDGDQSRFTRDYTFKSSSAAAAVIFGRSASGPASWRVDGEDITYKDWEARQLAPPLAAV